MSLTQQIKVTGDATSFNRTIAATAEHANKAFKAVGAELGDRIGSAFTVGAIIDRVVAFGHSIIEAADNVGDLADNLELSVEEVQKLGIAAQLAGTKFGRVERVMRTIQALRDQALAGDKAAMDKFQTLGINPVGLSPLELVRQMITAGEKSLAAQNVVADTFKANLTTIKNVLEKLDTLGPVDIFTESEVEKIGRAKDQFEELARIFKVSFAPALILISDLLSNWLLGMKKSFEGLADILFLNPIGKSGSKDDWKEFGKALANWTTGGISGTMAKDLSMLTESPARDKSTATAASAIASELKPAAAPLGVKGDALSRIGLFVGGSSTVGDRLVTIGNYQLSQLRSIREELRRMNE